jgi:two-component system sensor histidine kinase KdpD
MNGHWRGRALPAHYALPAGYAAMFLVGAVTAALHGALPAAGVLAWLAVVVAVLSAVSDPRAAPLLGVVGWLMAVGFSRPPYGQLRLGGAQAGRAALVMAACSLAAAGLGLLVRRVLRSYTVQIFRNVGARRPDAESGRGARRPGPASRAGAAAARLGAPPPQVPSASVPAAAATGTADAGVGTRRQVVGVALAALALPVITAALAAARPHLTLDDELLIYLVAVVAVAVVGGFWPAVLAAIAASLLLNWYFTPPLHTFTIEKPQNLLALLLFVTVAVAVSSVVHLAARRAVQAARSSAEAASLLALAQTVLGGADTAGAVLGHLVATLGGRAELRERVGERWVRVAGAGDRPAGSGLDETGEPAERIVRLQVRDGLELLVASASRHAGARLLDGFAAQAAAALDRERLRTQAAQAEALAEGNRMRTALLAAVSHDLRTPLASIKASVSTLRQADVAWTPEDEATLLATIEESADRLDALIGNLLDMSRLRTASLQPFLRAAAIDEVAPLALRGLDAGSRVQLLVPDGLPLVLTDPGLLERVLANLLSNALAHSPPDAPPVLRARRAGGDAVVIEVSDHGPGVGDADKERMFEPFERLDARGTGTGVGLGLAVAKGFAEAMGATLEAADTPGGGLTMRVRLSVAACPASPSKLAQR